MFFFFFFSSRRRHTRFDCDWSSDVCSSDLIRLRAAARTSPQGRAARDQGKDQGGESSGATSAQSEWKRLGAGTGGVAVFRGGALRIESGAGVRGRRRKEYSADTGGNRGSRD